MRRSTPAQWIFVILLITLVAAVLTHKTGMLDANWIIAVTSTTVAAAALVGLFGVLHPIQQAAKQRRRKHLAELVAKVIEPLASELKFKYHGVLARKSFPLDWNNGEGLRWGPIQSFIATAAQSRPTDANVFDKLYQHVKRNHYPKIIRQYEFFKSDYKGFGEYTLSQAKYLEAELKKFTDLPESAPQSRPHWFSAGNLALFAFNRIWMANYPGTLVVRKVQIPTSNDWEMFDPASSKYYACGPEAAVLKLRDHVEEVIRQTDKAGFVAVADELFEDLRKLEVGLAEIQTSDEVEGECAATR